MLTPAARAIVERINAQLRATLKSAQEYQEAGNHLLPDGAQSTESFLDDIEKVEAIRARLKQTLRDTKELRAMLRAGSE
jgi:hypothetical protein